MSALHGGKMAMRPENPLGIWHAKGEGPPWGASGSREADGGGAGEIDDIGALVRRISSPEGFKRCCQELYEYVHGRVVGQDESLKQLILTVMAYIRSPDARRHPALVAGEIGSGKTYSIRLLCRRMGIPFAEISAPELMPEEGRKADVCALIAAKVSAAVKRRGDCPERMVVHFDDFGALALADYHFDEIQCQLLKLLEPFAPILGKHSAMPWGKCAHLPQAFFVFSVAAPSHQAGTIGGLMDAGFTPEFAGRAQLVHPFRSLGAEDFEKMLLDAKGTVLWEKREACAGFGVSIAISSKARKAMATLAAGEGLGGRSLNHIVDAVVEKGLEGWAFSPGSGNALMIDEKTVAACFPEKPGRPRKIFGFAVQPDGDRLGVKRIAPPKKDSAAEDGRAKCFARREFGFAPPQPSDRVAAKVACVMMQR